jgi:uncharacterized protein YndB with AHSA1/START domain
MTTTESQRAVQTLHIKKDTLIAAPIELVFETVIEQAGPLAEMGLTLEPWPGGRWFRDLGNNTGHFWGHVQVIKPPKLLELCGPMMMSYPAASFVQYRLTEEAGGTRLTLTHQAMGLFLPEHLEGFPKGWGETVDAIKAQAEGKRAKAK